LFIYTHKNIKKGNNKENNITKFIDRVRAYNHDKEEINRRCKEILSHAAEDLEPLIGKTVEIKTKNKTYTGTFKGFSGYPRKEYVQLNPCTTGAISIHFLSIYGVKEVQK
jgi:hypothetical protein